MGIVRVEVIWEDSAAIARWEAIADVLSKDGKSLVRVHSIGYLLEKDDHVVVLAGSIDRRAGRVGRVALIPRGAIVKIRTIEKKARRR